jgi:hypothetical protein
MTNDQKGQPPNGRADLTQATHRYAPTTDGEIVPGILYENMLSMMRTDVVDLNMTAVKSKGYLVMWLTGETFVAYLPNESHITVFEMSIEQARLQFIALLELGWVVEVMSQDFKDAVFHHL